MPDWSGGMSASCKPRVQSFTDAGNVWSHSAAVSLAHANQLPLPRL